MVKDKEEQNKENPSPLQSCCKKISPFNTAFMIINLICLVTAAFWFISITTFHYKNDVCNRFVTTPSIFASILLLAMTLTGFFAAYLKADCLFRIHFFIFFLWMVVIIGKAVFVIFLHKETNPRLYPGTKIHEFRFEDYSRWVRRLVIKEDEWYRTKRCLVKENTCNTLLFSNQNKSASEFYQMNLTPIQSGCCKPPLSCGFKHEKQNVWTPSRFYNNLEGDCKTWNNSAQKLCFDCNSCKAATVSELHHNSFSVTVNVFQIFFSFFMGIIGWCAWSRSLQETQN